MPRNETIAASMADQPHHGLPGALSCPPLAGADEFCATPLFDLLRASAMRDPDKVALTTFTSSLSYAELFRLARRAADAVSRHTAPGQAVAAVLPRQPRSIAAVLGCIMAGRPCMIVNPADPGERHTALLEDAAPALLLTSGKPAFAYNGPVLDLDDALDSPDADWRPDRAWDPDAPFSVHFTSGSTGRPKGIVLSGRSVLYRGLFAVKTLGITRDSRVHQSDCPIASGGFSTMIGVLSLGARALLMDLAGDGAGSALRLFEREGLTVATFTVQMLSMLLKLSRAKAAFRDLGMLRLGGGSATWSDLQSWQSTLPAACQVMHSYASTEGLNMAQWIVSGDNPEREIKLPAGILQLCHDYTLEDEDGRPVPLGGTGELVLRSRYVALGEWRGGRLVPGRMPAITERPGWRTFRTGDVLRVHPDGMLRIQGRVDRQVKINGVLVQPAEIEAVLKSFPGVADAAVVARITETGASLHGFVVAETGASGDTATLLAGLRARLAARLPMTFRPATLIALDRLPMLPAGKIDLVALARSVHD